MDRVYAIGDIHGRADLLSLFRDYISQDVSDSAPTGQVTTILLGDLIDRGPDSKKVLHLLCDEPFPTRLIALSGNHERMMIESLLSVVGFRSWIRNGGDSTLLSYGIRARGMLTPDRVKELQSSLRAAMPKNHLTFLEGLGVSTTVGEYFFCHAGVRPSVSLAHQTDRDLLEIREEFLDFQGDFGKRIVHGHTPVINVDIRHNRVNLDTGAYWTGRLSGIKIEDGEMIPITIADR